MAGINVTVSIDEEIKRDFDNLCEDVGINMTVALNMLIKSTLRTRELPFSIADIEIESQNQARKELQEAFRAAQIQSVINGTDKTTMEEIDAEIARYRNEKREKSVAP